MKAVVQRSETDGRKAVSLAVAILALGGLIAALLDAPMIWDGAYQFCFSLIRQRPYFYLTRFHSCILWTPMVLLSHVTRNLTVLKLAYGLPFTLAPAVSVLMSWWIVRRENPRLILWAIFGVAAAPLPGQIFIINDSIFQQHMFWPVFLGLLTPLRPLQGAALAVLVIFQFSHQIGFVLLAGGAAAALLLSIGDRPHRGELKLKFVICVVLAEIALWKIVHFPDSYAQREFTSARIHESWTYGAAGYPLRGLACTWVAGAAILLAARLRDRWKRDATLFAWACIIAAAVIWTIWAADSHKWSDADNYRRWVVPLSIPFYLMAFLDAWRGSQRRDTDFSFRAPFGIGVATAGVFALILTIQSVLWAGMTRQLMRDVAACPTAIVPWSRISWTRDTALYHWGTTSYVFVKQGRTPRNLVLDPDPAQAAEQMRMLSQTPPAVPLAWFTPMPPTPGPAGWFDFRPMLQRIARERERAARTGSERSLTARSSVASPTPARNGSAGDSEPPGRGSTPEAGRSELRG